MCKSKTFILILLLFAFNPFRQSTFANPPGFKIVNLKCEYRSNPLGLDDQNPQLSWQIETDARGFKQTAYQILVASSAELLKQGKADVWNSGKVNSEESVLNIYKGRPLKSRKRYHWKVIIWDKKGQQSNECEPAWWEMGLLTPDEWKADWIGKTESKPSIKEDEGKWIWHSTNERWKMIYARKKISLEKNKGIANVQLKLSVDNCFEVKVNQHLVGSVREWQPSRGQRFNLYDITSYVTSGENLLQIAAVHTKEQGQGGLTGKVIIEYKDGSRLTVLTDENWEVNLSPESGWKPEAAAATGWAKAKVIESYGGKTWGNLLPPFELPKSALVRKEFTVSKKVSSARAHVTGLGGYYLHINGKKVSKDLLAPGLTHYTKRTQYQSYDITEYLKEGKNAVGAFLGNLWWSGDFQFRNMGYFSEGPLKFLMQMEIKYDDGTTEFILSDKSWKTYLSPITFNSIYDGEKYDARLEIKGWDEPGLNDRDWSFVEVFLTEKTNLVAEQLEPIQVTKEITPISVTEISPGKFIFDLGQNIAGWARLKVKGDPGTKVTLRFAEILKEDGNIRTDVLRTAKATDEYILKGEGLEVWEPRFTYHGFQYVEVTGFPGTPSKDAITGLVFHTNAPPRGHFSSSNKLINKIQENITWGQRGNMHSIVTDCPQRDERMGWTGDAQIFAATAFYNMDMTLMFRKYIRDMYDSQTDDGSIQNVNPNAWGEGAAPAGWADAIVIVPWRVYQFTGDKRILEESYPSIVKWQSLKQKESEGNLREKWTFGDWVSVVKTAEKPISSAYYFYSTKLIAQIAEILGKNDDAKKYQELSQKIADAFQEKYFHKDSLYYQSNTQTSHLLPLAFGITPEQLRATTAKNIAEDVRRRDVHLSTGFLGTQYILPILTNYGYHDLAYQLAIQRSYPSWGYMVDNGATTMWELWDSNKQGPDMNSRNHYAYGTVGEWFYGYLAGIRPADDAPGFKKTLIAPRPAGDLTNVEGRVETLYGAVESQWKKEGGKFTLNVNVPANTTAEVHMPLEGKKDFTVTENGRIVFTKGKTPVLSDEIKLMEANEQRIVFRVGSGKYSFVVD